MTALQELPTEELRTQVFAYLDEIKDPCSVASGEPMGLVEMGLVRSVAISAAGDVSICLRLTSPFCEMIGFMKSAALEKIGKLPAIDSVVVQSDSGLDWSPDEMSPRLRRRRQERLRVLRDRVAAPAGTRPQESNRLEML